MGKGRITVSVRLGQASGQGFRVQGLGFRV